jgi:hypothetical protein
LPPIECKKEIAGPAESFSLSEPSISKQSPIVGAQQVEWFLEMTKGDMNTTSGDSNVELSQVAQRGFGWLNCKVGKTFFHCHSTLPCILGIFQLAELCGEKIGLLLQCILKEKIKCRIGHSEREYCKLPIFLRMVIKWKSSPFYFSCMTFS